MKKSVVIEAGDIQELPDLKQVCAVVVSFNPNGSIFDHLSELGSQSTGVVVVDNGSAPPIVDRLKFESENIGYHFIGNEVNLGIAAALNIGIRWAVAARYRWVALFDQDSVLSEHYFKTIFATVLRDSDSEKTGIIAPKYIDPVSGSIYRPPMAKDGSVLRVMTSGTIMPVWIFEKCGWFEESFFIDWVDTEYSCRIREKGYKILLSEDTSLLHVPGSPRTHVVFGSRKIKSKHYSAGRRYYITRNGIVLVSRYWKQYPDWARYTLKQILFAEPVIMLLVESDRAKKLWNFFHGIVDALTRNMGKQVDP